MSIRKSLTVLWFVFTCSAQTWQVFGQTCAQTVTGCLSRGDSPGFYSIREEGTGFSITVTGSDDLAKYSAGNKVKLTGSTVREGDRDVFRVSNVEQLSTTCEDASLIGMECQAGDLSIQFNLRNLNRVIALEIERCSNAEPVIAQAHKPVLHYANLALRQKPVPFLDNMQGIS